VNEENVLFNLARKLMWWMEPAEALAQPKRFLMQIMVLGTWKDVQFAQKKFGLDAFKAALEAAEPGVFDQRSWSYWHARFGMPERPLPKRF
jgi:hypothetical protein